MRTKGKAGERSAGMNAVRILLILLGLSALSFFLRDCLHNDFIVSGVAYAQEDWKKEFDDICSKTQDAMVFNLEELRSLIKRCDTLRPLIERLEETQRKVYLRRLQMCRDLFSFVVESKEKM